jgi:hydroxyethylthiazole kinase-like uncharacterized protein yjeF
MEDAMKLVTVAEMKRMEQLADQAGHSYATMMELAGRAVARVLEQQMQVAGQQVLILVGTGNNGGDGLVAARYLNQAGAHVTCYLWKPRPDDDPNWQQVVELKLPCLYADRDPEHRELAQAAQSAAVVIDALLGTGVSRPIEGQLKQIMERVRATVLERRGAGSPEWVFLRPACSDLFSPLQTPLVVAVDVPSGLDCDTGAVDAAILPADLTVTFAAAKRGQLCFPGAESVGELAVADIGIDSGLGQDILTSVATARDIEALLPPRPLNAHKGTFGRAIVVAGSVNYTGAPYLAAAAAARVGTGLVTLAPPQPLHSILAARLAEATFVLLPHDMGVLTPAAVKVLASHLDGYRAMLLGPGLGREKETVAFVHQLLGIHTGGEHRQIGFVHEAAPSSAPLALPPLVIDADALNALADAADWWRWLPANCILTPHPGEMARLTGMMPGEADRVDVARQAATKWKQIVVLKGAFTVVAAPDGRTTVIPFANPGLATAGTGDVLAGAILGMLAQGLPPFDGAVCGAYLHALAGDIAVRQMSIPGRGAAGLLAGDLLPALPQAIGRLRAGASSCCGQCKGSHMTED